MYFIFLILSGGNKRDSPPAAHIQCSRLSYMVHGVTGMNYRHDVENELPRLVV